LIFSRNWNKFTEYYSSNFVASKHFYVKKNVFKKLKIVRDKKLWEELKNTRGTEIIVKEFHPLSLLLYFYAYGFDYILAMGMLQMS